jgi:co-chaperonin GroES (HSP10)
MKTIRTLRSDLANTEALLDEALRETFPASHPIACTPASEAGAPRTLRASGRVKGSSVGPGTRLEDGRRCEPDVKVGDRVLFGKYAGTSIKVEGEELLVMREADLLAVVTADSAP